MSSGWTIKPPLIHLSVGLDVVQRNTHLARLIVNYIIGSSLVRFIFSDSVDNWC